MTKYPDENYNTFNDIEDIDSYLILIDPFSNWFSLSDFDKEVLLIKSFEWIISNYYINKDCDFLFGQKLIIRWALINQNFLELQDNSNKYESAKIGELNVTFNLKQDSTPQLIKNLLINCSKSSLKVLNVSL